MEFNIRGFFGTSDKKIQASLKSDKSTHPPPDITTPHSARTPKISIGNM
jgi:hypothetical protein